MQKYIKTYLDHFEIGEQDLLTCEFCLKQGHEGFDVHHINGRSKATIKDLIMLCRKHHTFVHDSKISRGEVQLIHNNFLLGNRKVFVK